jgi:hypothetical protein
VVHAVNQQLPDVFQVLNSITSDAVNGDMCVAQELLSQMSHVDFIPTHVLWNKFLSTDDGNMMLQEKKMSMVCKTNLL